MKNNKINPAVVGAFVLFMLVLGIGMLVFMNSGRWFAKKQFFICYFPESVNGLTLGANVKFKGVQIGKVEDIIVNLNSKETNSKEAYVPVVISIDSRRVRNDRDEAIDLTDERVFQEQLDLGLSARLQYESIVTGMLFVELDYETKQHILPNADKDVRDGYKSIPVAYQNIKIFMDEMMDSVRKIDIEGISKEVHRFLTVYSDKMSEIDTKRINDELVLLMQNVNRNLDSVEDFRTLVKTINKKVEELDVKSLNTEAVVFLKQINQIDFKSLENSITQGSVQLSALMKKMEGTLNPQSEFMFRLQSTLDEFTKLSRVMAALGEYLERNPNAFITGKPDEE